MINVRMPEDTHDLKPRITVVGVGGAGGNAVNNMIRSQLEGVEFLVTNTDSQALKGNIAENKVQLGVNITGGLGAGSRPDIGRAAAEESLDEVVSRIEGSNMVFVTAGMGGGTGSGAAPVLAQAARDQGVLTVGVVTKPFHFEGAHRMKIAEEAIREMQDYVDTLIVIPNQNLFRIANEKTTFADAFRMADEVLQSGVRGVTDLMVMPGLINLDFADIRTVMAEMGKAMMGTGEASGEKRSLEAAEAAISNPLLDDVSLKGARGVLINITGGMDMTLFEVDEAVVRIKEEVDQDANIIFGSAFDETMEGVMRVSVVATGIDSEAAREARPSPLNSVTEATRRSVTGGGNAGMTAPAAKTGAATNASTGSGAGFTRSGSLPGGTPPAHVASSAVGGGMGAPAGATQPTAKSGGSTPMMGGGARPAQAEATMARGHAATAAAPVTMTATAEKLEVEADMVVAGDDEQLTPLERHVEATRKAETERSDMIPKFTRPAPRDPAGPRFEEEGDDAFTATGSRPMAQRYGESFIPPEPVDAGKAQGGTTAAQSSPAPSKADPFAEADMDNAGHQPAEQQPRAQQQEPAQQKRSLFERFTSRKESEGPSNPAEEQIMAKLQRNAEKEQQQPSMSVDSAEARTRKQGEDELDIPAFLRRQAN